MPVTATAAPEPEINAMDDRLVTLTTVRDRFEGEVIIARLRSQGIGALLYADDSAGLAAPTIQVEPATIRVQEKDLEAAREIVAQDDDL